MNSVLLSRISSWGQGYIFSQVCSTILATTSDLLVPGTCLISNQPVAGSIIVTHHISKGSLPFLSIFYGTIISTYRNSYGVNSWSFAGRCPYLVCTFLFTRHMWQVLHWSYTWVFRPFQEKCFIMVSSVLISPRWHNIVWYQYSILDCNNLETSTFLSLKIKRQSFSFPWKDLIE